MRISIVIPCRNAEATVANAVRSAFGQSEPPAEVLVVDDASTDRSADVAREMGARVLANARQRRAGGARNRGLEEARGDVIAFLDADAVAPSDWLARLRGNLEAHPEIVGVGGRIANGRPGLYGDLDYFLNHSEWIREGQAGPKRNIPTMAIAYRREGIGQIRFPETNSGEDSAFALAVLASGGTLWYDPQIVVTHQHERLDRQSFLEKQVACGVTLYQTRARLPLPGRSLVRFPVLLFLFPHLWIILARLVRAGHARRAVVLFPWLLAGEIARIRGFFQARRDAKGSGLPAHAAQRQSP